MLAKSEDSENTLFWKFASEKTGFVLPIKPSLNSTPVVSAALSTNKSMFVENIFACLERRLLHLL